MTEPGEGVKPSIKVVSVERRPQAKQLDRADGQSSELKEPSSPFFSNGDKDLNKLNVSTATLPTDVSLPKSDKHVNGENNDFLSFKQLFGKRINKLEMGVYDKIAWGEVEALSQEEIQEEEQLKKDVLGYVDHQLSTTTDLPEYFDGTYIGILMACRGLPRLRDGLISLPIDHREVLMQRCIDPNISDVNRAALQVFLAIGADSAKSSPLTTLSEGERIEVKQGAEDILDFVAETFTTDYPQLRGKYKAKEPAIIRTFFDYPGDNEARYNRFKDWFTRLSQDKPEGWGLLRRTNVSNLDKLRNFVIEMSDLIPFNIPGVFGVIVKEILKNDPGALRAIGEKNVLLEKYNLPLSFLEEWIKNPKPSLANIDSVEKLEAQQPGICRTLYEEFGIIDFARYPVELLLKQLQERDRTDVPYGVIVYPRDDHNGAFAQNVDVFSNLLKQTEGKYLLRVIEIEGVNQGLQKLSNLQRRYGRMSFGIIGGHGTKRSIQFGKAESHPFSDRVSYQKESGELLLDALQNQGRRAQAVARLLFNESAPLVLVSCSTGEARGIGQQMSELRGFSIQAPANSTNIKDIQVVYSDDERIADLIPIYKDDTRRRYVAGQNS